MAGRPFFQSREIKGGLRRALGQARRINLTLVCRGYACKRAPSQMESSRVEPPRSASSGSSGRLRGARTLKLAAPWHSLAGLGLEPALRGIAAVGGCVEATNKTSTNFRERSRTSQAAFIRRETFGSSYKALKDTSHRLETIWRWKWDGLNLDFSWSVQARWLALSTLYRGPLAARRVP